MVARAVAGGPRLPSARSSTDSSRRRPRPRGPGSLPRPGRIAPPSVSRKLRARAAIASLLRQVAAPRRDRRSPRRAPPGRSRPGRGRRPAARASTRARRWTTAIPLASRAPRPTTVSSAITPSKGVDHPLALVRGNHVQVREQYDRVASSVAREASPGRSPLCARDGGGGLDHQRFEALLAEDVDEILRQGPLVARRVAGIELDGPGEDGSSCAPRVRRRVGIIQPVESPDGRTIPRGGCTGDHRQQEEAASALARGEKELPTQGVVLVSLKPAGASGKCDPAHTERRRNVLFSVSFRVPNQKRKEWFVPGFPPRTLPGWQERR